MEIECEAITNKKLSTIKPKVEECEKEKSLIISQLIGEMNKNKAISNDLPLINDDQIESKMIEKFPDYDNIMHEYTRLNYTSICHKRTLDKLEISKKQNSRYKDQITEYLETINEYLFR